MSLRTPLLISLFGLIAALCWSAGATSADAQVTVQGQVQVQGPYVAPAPPPPAYGTSYPTAYPAQTRQLRYVESTESIYGLWVTGLIVFPVSYVLTGTMATALSYNDDYATYSWIPLVGPWLMLGEANGDAETGAAIAGGVAQLAGLTMFVLGLTLRRTVRVAVYALGDGEHAPELALNPLPLAAGGGLSATLTHF